MTRQIAAASAYPTMTTGYLPSSGMFDALKTLENHLHFLTNPGVADGTFTVGTLLSDVYIDCLYETSVNFSLAAHYPQDGGSPTTGTIRNWIDEIRSAYGLSAWSWSTAFGNNLLTANHVNELWRAAGLIYTPSQSSFFGDQSSTPDFWHFDKDLPYAYFQAGRVSWDVVTGTSWLNRFAAYKESLLFETGYKIYAIILLNGLYSDIGSTIKTKKYDKSGEPTGNDSNYDASAPAYFTSGYGTVIDTQVSFSGWKFICLDLTSHFSNGDYPSICMHINDEFNEGSSYREIYEWTGTSGWSYGCYFWKIPTTNPY